MESRIENAWNELNISQPFSYSWLDEQINKNNSQSATISLLGYLAFIAISIASLGLLGFVIYTIEVKRKEISIRKIIGAGEKQLIKLLSLGFIKLIFLAGLIAMPLGYVAGFYFYKGLHTNEFWAIKCIVLFPLFNNYRTFHNYITNL